MLIAVLAFLVLGVFVVAEAPRSAPNSANASWKENANASGQHAKSVKGTEIHDQQGRGYLHRDLKSGHHSS